MWAGCAAPEQRVDVGIAGRCARVLDPERGESYGEHQCSATNGPPVDRVGLAREPVSCRARPEIESELRAVFVPLDELLRKADYVTIHADLNASS